MLVLSRKIGERIWIGDNIAVTVVRITGGGVRLGIEAPAELPVVREELKTKMEQEIDPAQLQEPTKSIKIHET
ncbi:MAG: carbon storage regulator CsrA [Mariniblastus sp.]|nr:carbon storage regulator CsrA [Mariniblastus sp.]